MRYLSNDVFPVIGAMPISEIKVTHIKNLLDDIMARGVNDTADKIRGWIGAVFDYSAMLEISENNPARLLKNHIPNLPTKHKPALPREELPEFFRRLILANSIERQNKIAIMLIMLVFVRNNELRGGQWQEVDFKNKRWIIPAERMKHEKMKPKPALCVPLSDWAIELLQELHPLTGHSRFMFSSRTSINRHFRNLKSVEQHQARELVAQAQRQSIPVRDTNYSASGRPYPQNRPAIRPTAPQDNRYS